MYFPYIAQSVSHLHCTSLGIHFSRNFTCISKMLVTPVALTFDLSTLQPQIVGKGPVAVTIAHLICIDEVICIGEVVG